MRLFIFNGVEEADKASAVKKLITQSTPSQDFFFMMTLSILMAVFGILLESVAVIIGSMLIAPLLSSVLSLSLGITMADSKLIRRSFQTILKSLILGVAVSTVATLIFGAKDIPEFFIVSSDPSLLAVAVAIVAGFAATFALVKPKLNETLPGVAIAVALIPPIAFIGIGLAEMSWSMMTNALILLGLNIAGIIFAGMITFSLMNFYTKKKVAEITVIKEDKKLEEEEPKEKSTEDEQASSI